MVELLAVIVILAIILVIAVPKIMSVITDSKKSSLETSAKMIASSAEKIKLQKELLGVEITGTVDCSEFTKVTNDYASCKVKFDGNTAKVNITGANKFEGLYICGADKNNATSTNEICTTDGKYFSYEKMIEVEDVSKCTTYLNVLYPNTDDFPTREEENAQICNGTFDGVTITAVVKNMGIPSTDYEEAGLSFTNANISITGYNIKGGTDVIIPSTIDGYIVTGISDDAFTSFGIIPEVISNNNGYNVSNLLKNNVQYEVEKIDVGYGLGIKSVVIPNTVTTIGIGAFYGNPLTKVYLENTNIEIGNCAFGDKSKLSENNLPNSYMCFLQ